MRSIGVGLTDIGRRRTTNEDSLLIDDELGLYVVADGMGGHAAGEIASREAVETVHGMVQRGYPVVEEFLKEGPNPARIAAVQRLLESAVQAACYMVFTISELHPQQRGMGTTVSALLLFGEYGVTAQVGDSRIYLMRKGELIRLTDDHTLVAWQVRQGILTEAEAEASPHKNVITRAVGSREYVQVDTHLLEARAKDRFLLCSDGMYGYANEGELGEILSMKPEAAAPRLIEVANERGGQDNITALVVELHA